MYVSFEDRKIIQILLENEVSGMEDAAEKSLHLLALSLIYELNERDGLASPKSPGNECREGGQMCFWKFIQAVVDGFYSLETPHEVDDNYLQKLTHLADSLTRLSIQAHDFQSVLARIHATGKQLTEYKRLTCNNVEGV